MKSLAPYEEIPYGIARERKVSDRQAFRLIGRLWSRLNANDNAPIRQLWQELQDVENSYRLPLGEAGIHSWFIRACGSAVWFASTNVGGGIVRKLQKTFEYDVSVKSIELWFADNHPRKPHEVTHECTAACKEENYHLLYGWGTYCEERLAPRDTELSFYLVMRWFCSIEGRQFFERYEAALCRLYKLRGLERKNDRFRRDILRKGGL